MDKLVLASQMSAIDKRTQEEYAIPGLILMENAGLNALNTLVNDIWQSRPIPGIYAFLVGRGNNGGDALVMARQFYCRGKRELVIILGHGEPEAQSLAACNLASCRALGISVLDYIQQKTEAENILNKATVIFDGLLGTGLSGEIRQPLKEIVSLCNSLSALKIALDLPSGLGDEYKSSYLAFKADYTLSFGLPKKACYLPHARPYCGQLFLIDICLPPSLKKDPSLKSELYSYNDFGRLLPSLSPTAYKNSRGHCAVFAGSPGTSGAALLASEAAARTRCGLVTLFTDPAVWPSCASQLKSVLCQSLVLEKLSALNITKSFSSLLVGPGLGLGEEKMAVLKFILQETDLPLVIDADGLTLLAQLKPRLHHLNRPLVLTPHPGELARFFGLTSQVVLEDPWHFSQRLADELKAVCVFKSHVSLICDPQGRQAVCDGLNPALGTAGSGDVLAGLIAGFLGQGIDPFHSALLGVLVHHECGRKAFAQKGWFLAEDLLTFISEVVKGF